MNDNKLFVIVLVAIVVAIFSVISGMLAADGSPVAAGLTLIPLFLAGVCLMKEKVWYLWFLLPPLVSILPHGEYGRLLIFCGTLPFYIWNVMIKRTTAIWNKAPFLDVAVFLIIAYVGLMFIRHPFALGIDIMQDYYGGKGYVLFLQALVVYLSISSLKTDSDTIGKLLQWGVALTVLTRMITTVRGILNPESISSGMVGEDNVGEDARNVIFLQISMLAMRIIIIRYGIIDLIKRPWWIVVAGAACAGIMVSGFRSALASVAIFFGVVSVLYKRWIIIIVLPVLGLSMLLVMSSLGLLRDMPYGVQRVCSAVSFLDVNPVIRCAAESSTDWRVEMWEWALDDRENFIKDKVWGDGFVKPMSELLASNYQKAYGLTHGNQEEFAWGGQWHSGRIVTIQTAGYVGLALVWITYVVGSVYAWIVSKIYLYHKYRLGILYLTSIYLTVPIAYFVVDGGSIVETSSEIVSLAIIKLLYNCAKREGLYEPLSIRTEYVPLMIRKMDKS